MLLTGKIMKIEKLSDINYKIAPVNQPQKHSVVHFDRLKLCSPSMCWSNSTLPHMPEPVPPSQSLAGEGAELVDDSVEEERVINRPSPRYPHRQRHPPDRLLPFVSH